MTTAKIRKNYEELASRDANSKYRREREYAAYVARFLHSTSIVDGMTPEDRKDKLPLSYNRYFG